MISPVLYSPDTGGAGSGVGIPEKDKFTSSFLVKDEDEINQLTHEGLQKRVRALHDVAIADPNHDVFKRQAWVDELKGITDRMVHPLEGEDVYPPKQAVVFCARINQEIEDYDKKIYASEEILPTLDVNVRSTKEVIGDFNEIINNPDPAKEAKIKQDLEILGAYAKKIKMFDGVKEKIEEIQRKLPFLEAAKKIKELDLRQEGIEAQGLEGWDPKLAGMIDVYRNAAFYNMMKVWSDLKQPTPFDADRVSKFVDILNYENPPIRKLMDIASAQLQLASQGGGSGSEDRIAEAIRETSVPPAEQRRQFLEVEELARGEVQIPLTTSLIFKDLSPEERKFWMARMELSNGRSLRTLANSPENLFPNPHLQGMTKEGLKSLYDTLGVAEAQAIYTVFATEPDCRGFSGPFGELIKNFSVQREKKDSKTKTTKIIETGIKNLHDIKNETELKKFRKQFRQCLQNRFHLTESQARDAEQVGFNLFIVSDINEYVDSKDYYLNTQKSDRERIPTALAFSVLISPAQRDLIHPLEKSIDDNRKRKVTRAWPLNPLGEFIKAHPDYDPDKKPNKIPIPYTLTEKGRSFLHEVDIVLPNGKTETLYDQIRRDGLALIKGTIRRASRIDWDSVQGEYPFLPYLLTKNKQILVWNTLSTGSLPRDKTMDQLINAMNDLDIDDHFRETLAYLMDEETRILLMPRRKEFKPNWGLLDLGIAQGAFFDKFRDRYPGFFKNIHTSRSTFGKIANLGS